MHDSLLFEGKTEIKH